VIVLPLRVWIVAHDAAWVDTVERRLHADATPEIDVVGHVVVPVSLVAETRRSPSIIADVAVAVLQYPDAGVLAQIRTLTEMDVPTTAMLGDPTLATEAWGVGARGLVLSDTEGRDLAPILHAVARRSVVLAPDVHCAVLFAELDEAALLGSLEEQDYTTLEMVAQGLTNVAIGRRLGIAERTVKHHLEDLYRRLGVRSRAQAAVRWSRLAALRKMWTGQARGGGGASVGTPGVESNTV